ncbi:MAG TPA: type II toxin-antitoxin system VapC family toxin [Firmicutes bacterium]|nr:type II toxin-antitoxin system VapC family toxin [Bacillota bacterium]
MSGEPPLVYLDASVFLAHFKGEAGRVQDCQAVFSEARDGKIRAATSVLSLIEANRGTSLADEEIEKIDAFFEHSWLRAVTLDAGSQSKLGGWPENTNSKHLTQFTLQQQ